MATYLLIKPINDVETVDNAIIADEVTAATYLVANGGDYDYALDASEYDPQPGIGYTYDPENDVFTAPPEDFQAELEMALIAVDTAIEAAAEAYAYANEGQRSAAVSNVMGELGDEDQDEQDLMSMVVSYISGLV